MPDDRPPEFRIKKSEALKQAREAFPDEDVRIKETGGRAYLVRPQGKMVFTMGIGRSPIGAVVDAKLRFGKLSGPVPENQTVTQPSEGGTDSMKKLFVLRDPGTASAGAGLSTAQEEAVLDETIIEFQDLTNEVTQLQAELVTAQQTIAAGNATPTTLDPLQTRIANINALLKNPVLVAAVAQPAPATTSPGTTTGAPAGSPAGAPAGSSAPGSTSGGAA